MRAPGRRAANWPLPRVVTTIDELPESEQGFVKRSRQISQLRVDAKRKRIGQRDRDVIAIENLANAIYGATDGDVGAIATLDRLAIAADADVILAGKRGANLWIEASGLMRDVVREIAKAEANGGSASDVDFRIDYDRDLRIATNEMCSATAVETRKAGERPFTKRQAQLVKAAYDNYRYLDQVRNMPGQARVAVHLETDADGQLTGTAPLRYRQSASDRFDKDGRGYVFDASAWVGGKSNQENGGTCYQLPFVEKGKRSAKSSNVMRIVAATPKVGSRRRGITDKKKLEAVKQLHDRGWTAKRIAVEIDETVSRVHGAIYAQTNDARFHTGLNNDQRLVHRKKRVALDQIHGNLRTDCREVIRVDCDRIWETWADFEDWLNSRLAWAYDGEVRPPRPHLVVYVRDDRFPERVTKPHLIFILPEGSGVWYGNRVGLPMFNAVAGRLTSIYEGDAGGLANVSDCKLPTSPHTVFVDTEKESYPTLGEMCKQLDIDLAFGLERTMRAMTVAEMIEAGIDEDTSGALYSLFWKRAWEIALLWESMGQLRIGDDLDRRKLANELLDALLTDEILGPELDALDEDGQEAAQAGMTTAARKVAEKFGTGREAGTRGYDLGAAEKLVAQAIAAATVEGQELSFKDRKHAAQSAGQAYSRQQRVGRSIRRIADAIRTIAADGTVPTPKAVQTITKQDPRTIGKHWDAAVALVAANQIVHAVLTVPEQVSVAPAFSSSVWGVPEEDSSNEQPTSLPVPGQPTSGEPLTLASTLSPPVITLVARLSSRIPAQGPSPTGRNLLEFVRPGATLYRSTHGIREQSRRRRKGLRAPYRRPTIH